MKKRYLITLIMLLFTFVGCSNNCTTTTTTSNTNNTTSSISNNSQKEVVEVNYGNSNYYSSMVNLIEDVKPSVVDIYSYMINGSSAGSGVIVGKSENSYYVITNHHVIDQALEFDVVTYTNDNNSKTYSAKLIGSSPSNDIAVLEVKTSDDLVVANFISDSSKVKIGTEVIAIGNPLGILGGSVTHGIISATERMMYLDNLGYMKLFQTDAAINSGNSGGALFNYEGLLIGIVNSGYTSYEGLNFAIPSNTAAACFTSIVNTYNNNGNNLGYMEGESKLGITFNTASFYSDSQLKSQINAIYVYSIDSNSDADQKGILSYYSYYQGSSNTFYAVSKVNGNKVENLDDLLLNLQEMKAGETISFTFVEVSYVRSGGFFGSSVLYLTDKEINIDIKLSQYIYSPNNN